METQKTPRKNPQDFRASRCNANWRGELLVAGGGFGLWGYEGNLESINTKIFQEYSVVHVKFMKQKNNM